MPYQPENDTDFIHPNLPHKRSIPSSAGHFGGVCIAATFFVLTMLCTLTYGQDLNNLIKAPLLTLNGGFSLNQVFFQSKGSTTSSREPYAYTISGNLNLTIHGWLVPFSMVYSNKQWSHSQPFNQYTLAPSYKWIKLYIGNASMTFSPYTLSGHQFWGFGAELSPPGKYSLSVMAGRLQKKVIPDSSSSVEPAYQRIGAGFKVGYQIPLGSLTAIVFYAKDDSSSLHGYNDSLTIFPQENLCLGLSGNFTLFRSFTGTFDYATSTLTENLYSSTSQSKYAMLPFFKRKESTHCYQALKTSFNYNSWLGSVGFGYERVGAGYATLGVYYSSNDFANYTINYAGGILKNKVTLSLSYGLQKDDLSGIANQNTTRTVENINVGFTPSQQVAFTIYYSDFNNYTHVKTVFDDINTTSPYANLDTLSYTQISKNLGGSASVTLGNKEKITHRITGNGAYQEASQDQAGSTDYAGTQIYTASAGYSIGLTRFGLTPSLTVNYNRNLSDTTISEVIGPSINIRKAFFERKLNTSLMISYNQSLIDGIRQGENTILRLSATYVIQKKHNFTFSSAAAIRNSKSSGKRSENTITLNYSYSFGWKKKKTI